MKTKWLAALAFVCASISSQETHAYVASGPTWAATSLPVGYELNTTSTPSYLDANGARDAINQGFSAWTMPACTSWRVNQTGTTSIATEASDNHNVVFFESNTWNSRWGDPNVTLGVTFTRFVSRRYVEADMVFNAVRYRWTLDGRSGPDLRSIATHEAGHFLGLNHTPINTAVMFASYSGGLKRDLHSDDVMGVCALYPSGTAPPPDGGVTPTDPCNNYNSCGTCTPVDGCGWCAASNRCITGGPTGPSGVACGGAWAWQPTECTSLPRPDASAPPADVVTSDPCNARSSCTTCTPINGCGWCEGSRRCMTGTQTGATAGSCSSGWRWVINECTMSAFGEPCSSSAQCGTGNYCVTYGATRICTRSCSTDCDCAMGFECADTNMPGVRICYPGTNTCSTPPGPDASVPRTDSSVSRDTGVAPGPDAEPEMDAGSTPGEDASLPSEAGAREGGSEGGTMTNPGCACTAPGKSQGSSRLNALALLGLATLLVSRRRK